MAGGYSIFKMRNMLKLFARKAKVLNLANGKINPWWPLLLDRQHNPEQGWVTLGQ